MHLFRKARIAKYSTKNLTCHFTYLPKKDRCDLCSKWEISKKENILTSELDEKHTIHLEEKYVYYDIRKK